MFKGLKFALAGLLVCVCANAVEIEALNGANEKIKINVPSDPKKVAVADLATLDTLDSLGLGNKVNALTKNTKIDYLAKYFDNKNIAHIGSVKEVDIEKLLAAEPEIIFIGSRLASKYDELSKIAPVVYLGIDYANGTFKSVKKNAEQIAKIFNVSSDEIFKNYEKRLNDIKAKANGKSAIIGLVTKSNFNTLGNLKRCAMIGTDAGFKNIANDAKTTHGNDASFELILKLNPDYIFVLDRDNAINNKGSKTAKEVMANPIIDKTNAAKNGKIYYLNPSVWYLTEGGIKAMDFMLSDLENALKE